MAVSLVHTASRTSATSAITSVTIPSTTAGNCLILVLGFYSASATNPSVSSVLLGGSADHWTQASSEVDTTNHFGAWIYVDNNCAGGQTNISWSPSNNGAGGWAYVFEVTGQDTGASALASSAHGTADPTASGTRTQTGGAFDVGYSWNQNATVPTSTAGAPWTEVDLRSASPSWGVDLGYIAATSGATRGYGVANQLGDSCIAGFASIAAAPTGDVAATETATATATATATSPGSVSKTTAAGSTVAVTVSSPASVTATSTATSVATVPVPVVTATETATATASASVSSPGGTVSATVATSAATANTTQHADVTKTTTATATATGSVPANATAAATASATTAVTVVYHVDVTATTTALTRLTHTRGGARVASYYGPLVIGRLTLTESPESAGKADTGRVLSVEGQEASPALSADQAAAWERAEGLLAYRGAVVPVQFTDKPHLNGWYQVDSPTADESTWGDITTIRWKCDLIRAGGDSEVEIESRLVGGDRAHASAAAAELWHAAAINNDSYLVGTSTPGTVARSGEDGTILVYRGLPAAENPRWSVPAASYLKGAAVVTVNGYVRMGLTGGDTPWSWTLSNGLVKVEPRTSTGTLKVSSYLTSSWGTAKVFDLKRGSTSLGLAQHVTILRNDPCECVIRLTWDHSPGRTTCDLSLKRGARHVGLFINQYASGPTLGVDDNGAAFGTFSDDHLAGLGYIAAAANDTDGNRWVIGTTLSCGTPGTLGLETSSGVRSLPAYIGAVYGGSGATSGDTAADVNAQFLGTPSETERLIQR